MRKCLHRLSCLLLIMSKTLPLCLFIGLSVISCKDEVINVEPEPQQDPDGSVIWHYGEMDLLDSLSEYTAGITTLHVAWSYDEFGRPIERNEYRLDYEGEEHQYRSQWSYSDGGKAITIIMAEQEESEWNETIKSLVTVVADRDSCTKRYKKVGDKWLLDGFAEVVYDSDGRLVMSCSYSPDSNNGSKREYTYDDYGRCILEKNYARSNGEWMLTQQSDFSFDDRGNCLLNKVQRYHSGYGRMIGDSLVERSFDIMNHVTAYSLMKWDNVKSGWVGIQKYEMDFDEIIQVIRS